MKSNLKLFILALYVLCSAAASAAIINVPSNFSTIQEAVDAAQPNDTIIIASGTYNVNLTISNKSLVLASNYILSQNEADVNSTIIKSAALPTDNFPIISVSGSRAYSLKIIGLSIEDGFNSQALYVSGYTTQISNSSFSGNSAGAIYIMDGDARITKSSFSQNASTFGGAVYLQMVNEDRTIQVDSCTFTSNTSVAYGGAIYSTVYKSELKIIGNSFSGNSSNRGGAISIAPGTNAYIWVMRNVMANNSANTQGGAVYVNGRSTRFINNTIVNNRLNSHGVDNKGAAMYFTGSNSFTTAMLTNNIIRDNATEPTDKEVYLSYSAGADYSKASISYCALDGNTSNYVSANTIAEVEMLSGNITANPLFVDFATGNYSLQQNSPCIDAGNPDILGDGMDWETDPFDQDPDGSRLDIGAIPYLDITPVFEANFTFTQVDEYAPAMVNFKDASTVANLPAVTSWFWNFGNGATSAERNPLVSYEVPGTYNVSLTISNGDNTSTKTITNCISVLGVESGYYTQLIVLPMQQQLNEGQLTGYTENGVPFSIGYALNADNNEMISGPFFTSNGLEYWAHQARFEFDLSAIDGRVLEVSVKVADNNGGSKFIVYQGANAIHNQNIPNGLQFKWYTFKANTSQYPSKVIFSSFEGGITELRVKVKKEVPAPILNISVYAPTCNLFMFSPIIENAPEGNISYKWVYENEVVSEENFYSSEFSPGEHYLCLQAYSDENPEEYLVEKCINFNSESISTSFTYTYYPVEKRIEMAARTTSVGEVTYHWTLGDGNYIDGSLTASHTYSSNGTYYPTFVATAADNFGCFANNSIELVVSDVEGGTNCENNSIVGILDAGLSMVNFSEISIELFKLNANSFATLQTVTEVDTESGSFTFSNLPEGEYFLRASLVNPENYPFVLVSYFNNLMEQVVTWQQASPIQLTCNVVATIDLTMANILGSSGYGSISGIVGYTNNEAKSGASIASIKDAISFMPNVTVMLKAWGTIIKVTRTNENGEFSIQGIPFDEYELLIDIPGCSLQTTHNIEIWPGQEEFSNANFLVYSNAVAVAVTEPLSVDQSGETSKLELGIYPNPSNGNAQLTITSNAIQQCEIEVATIAGQTVFTSKNLLYEGDNSFSMQNLQSGVYIVFVKSSNAIESKKLIVK